MELRSDIAAAAARMASGYEVQREIRRLAAYLRQGETVHRLASGVYGAGPGLLAVTSHRVLLLRDGRSGQASEGFPLERLSVAEWARDGVVGTITVSDSHSTAVLRDVPAVEGAEAVSTIRMLTDSDAAGPARRWSLTGADALGTGALGAVGSPSGAGPAAPRAAGPEATRPVSGYPGGRWTGADPLAVPTQSAAERTHASGAAARASVPTGAYPESTGAYREPAGVYPDQYAPSANPGAAADELTRGAVPVSVLARTGTIPAQPSSTESPLRPLPEPSLEPAAERTDTDIRERRTPVQRPQVEPPAMEHSGVLGSSPEIRVGEVPVSQLAAEETVALSIAEPRSADLSETDSPADDEGTAETDDAEPDGPEAGTDATGRERPKPINWKAPSGSRRAANASGSSRKGTTKGSRAAVRVEATSKPSAKAPGPRAGQGARSKKWIWLGAGAAGLITLAALGSAKLISTNQPVAAPVSPAPAAVDAAAGPVVTVTNVINGDTVEVSGQFTGVVEVLGIVAPRQEKNQCGGAAAQAFAVKTLNNTTVTLVSDPSQPVTTRTGHRLAFLRLPNGADYSVLAVQAGMARYYPSQPPVSTAADITAAEAQAQRNHAGLWGPPCSGKLTGAGATSTTGTAHSSGATTSSTRTGGTDSTGTLDGTGTSGTGN
jgi:endonuclease YncB( thermonuclease family)